VLTFNNVTLVDFNKTVYGVRSDVDALVTLANDIRDSVTDLVDTATDLCSLPDLNCQDLKDAAAAITVDPSTFPDITAGLSAVQIDQVPSSVQRFKLEKLCCLSKGKFYNHSDARVIVAVFFNFRPS
jgi:hypothetical protein